MFHRHNRRVALHAAAAATLACLVLSAHTSARAADTALDAMVATDAAYIPALALTSAAAADAKAVPKAQAAFERLQRQWPSLQAALAARPPAAAQPKAWAAALLQVDRRLRTTAPMVTKGDWAGAHDALEGVRDDLMAVRTQAGFPYFVDRLTAFHAPMETLALMASSTSPAALTAAQRVQMETAFAQARALWAVVEREAGDLGAYRLSPAREAQLRQGMAAESVALSAMSEALRGSDNRALLAAAAALKKPYSRAFTAFGAAEGETLAP